MASHRHIAERHMQSPALAVVQRERGRIDSPAGGFRHGAGFRPPRHPRLLGQVLELLAGAASEQGRRYAGSQRFGRGA
jgi:hypothetical protein